MHVALHIFVNTYLIKVRKLMFSHKDPSLCPRQELWLSLRFKFLQRYIKQFDNHMHLSNNNK